MNKVIDIIIEFVKASKKEAKDIRLECVDGGETYAFNKPKYLLGQLIRQYSLPWSHYLISEKAKQKWESITDEPIGKYWSQSTVTCSKEGAITISKYRGAASTPYETCIITKGDKFKNCDVFHDEHMVTVEDIIEELISLDDISKDNVIKTLSKIYICRILKEEDRKLYPKVHRGTDIEYIIKEVYSKCGIEVVYDYFKDSTD